MYENHCIIAGQVEEREIVQKSNSACAYGILAQLGEHLPYKQRVIGSSPIGPTLYADVAQLAEQLICNQQVIGSSPIIGLRMDSRVAKGSRL